MNDPVPAPEDKPAPPGGKSDAPASTTDLGRFPEKPETGEVSSLFAGEDGGVRAPDEPKAPVVVQVPPDDGSAPAEPGLDFDPQIKIERKIAAGGMGEVFLGYQKHLDRKVAVKRIRSWDADTRDRERFIQEAKAHSSLQHPGIAQVYDFREAGDSFYLVMEYVDGKTLEELLASEGKFAPDRIVRIGVQLTEALESAAHEGYIHRDLKPGNVMLTGDGKVKIIDFGLALRFRNLMQTRVTQKGDILGTPAYMSPEQLNQEEKLDVQSDIWALGVLLYALATGSPPFTGKDFACTLRNVMIAEPAPLPTIEPGFPAALWQAIAKALKKDRAERWQDYPSFRQALLEVEGRPQGAPDPSSVPVVNQAPRPSHRTLIGFGVAAALLVAVVLGSQLFSRPKEDAKKPAGESADRVSLSDHRPAGGKDESPKTSPEPEDQKATSKSAPGVIADERLTADPAQSNLPPKPAAPVLSLRQRLAQYPLGAEDTLFISQILAAFSKHRTDLLNRGYEPLAKELEGLTSSKKTEYRATQLEAAQDLVRLASGLVSGRWRGLTESKEEIRLKLLDGKTSQGIVESADERGVTLLDGRGGKTSVPFATIAPEEFLRGSTFSQAEVAYQSLSGDAAKGLVQAQELEKGKDQVALWYPVLVRLARLQVVEEIRATIEQAEAPLSRREARQVFEKTLTHYPQAVETLRALSTAETDLRAIYPFLEREFKEAQREGEALELLLDGACSKVLANTPGTEAQTVAARLLLVDFLAKLEPADDDVIAKAGWFNYNWELRPDEPSVKERIVFWDLLDGGGCVLRDPKGPRSLIMGRPHPRASEGFLIQFEFEPLGEDPASAEWRFNLRREGGGMSYLRFGDGSLSLRTSTLGGNAADETLFTAKVPGNPAERRTHTCALVPGEQLLVFLDGVLVAALKKEETILPSQPSLVVRSGKLSIRSIQVMKKPPK